MWDARGVLIFQIIFDRLVSSSIKARLGKTISPTNTAKPLASLRQLSKSLLCICQFFALRLNHGLWRISNKFFVSQLPPNRSTSLFCGQFLIETTCSTATSMKSVTLTKTVASSKTNWIAPLAANSTFSLNGVDTLNAR